VVLIFTILIIVGIGMKEDGVLQIINTKRVVNVKIAQIEIYANIVTFGKRIVIAILVIVLYVMNMYKITKDF